MILEMGRSKGLNISDPLTGAIKWKGGLPAFPADGDISTIPQAIELLNQASREFDRLKYYYVPFDPEEKRWSYAHPIIQSAAGKADNWRLPSVGYVNESNWRQKIIQLSSGIDQLKVIPWPVETRRVWGTKSTDSLVSSGAATPSVAGFYLNIPETDEYTINNDAGGEVANDVALANYASCPSETIEANMFLWECIGGEVKSTIYPTKSESAYLWTNGIAGIKADLQFGQHGSAQGVAEHFAEGPSFIASRLFMLVAPEIQGYGNNEMTETYVQSLANKEMQLGAYIVREIPQQDGMFIMGNMNAQPSTAEEAATLAWQFINLPMPVISGSMSAQHPSDPNVMQLQITQAPAKRDGEQNLKKFGMYIQGKVLLAPDFTPCTEVAWRDYPLLHELGEVETTVAMWDLFRIHCGRGKGDGVQQACLRVREGGFGTVVFDGSPAEFDVIYETDPIAYEDAPLGGITYEGEFTVAQQADAWASTPFITRAEYIRSWFCPRLKQVKGQDVLLCINYVSSYQKIIQCYWATDAGGKQNGFYQPTGQPFKTLVIKSPPANGAATPMAFPQEANLFHIEDDATRKVIRVPLTDWYNGQYDFEFAEGTLNNGSVNIERSCSVRVRDSFSPETVYTIDETEHGVARTIVERYSDQDWGLWTDPLWLERPLLVRRSVSSDTVTRSTTLKWERVYENIGGISDYYYYTYLHEVSNSLDPSWAHSGKACFYGANGVSESEQTMIAGKIARVEHSWNDNARTSVSKLDGNIFVIAEASYSNDLKELAVTIDGQLFYTLKYRGVGEGQPWTLKEALYPGGYREVYWSDNSGDHSTFSVLSGWGTSLSAGKIATVITDRLGGVASRSIVTSEGVVLESLAGSEFTKWGAPKKIISLRGDETIASYYESGRVLGRRATTNHAGITRSASYDGFQRVSTVNTGFETINLDHSVPLKTTAISSIGTVDEVTFSAFGEIKSGSSTFGTGSSFVFDPSANSSVALDGRSVSIIADAAGFVSAVSNGALKRGGLREIGVAGGRLFSKNTERTESGLPGSNEVVRFYDGQGRVISEARPTADGNTATATWVYDDANRQVIYTPGVGPVAQGITSTLSMDGTTRTINKGGQPYLRETRAAADGSLVLITELSDDSSGGGAEWKEVSRQTINSGAGTVTTTPWSLAANAVTLLESVPGAQATRTITNGLTGDSLTMTLAGDVPSALSGTFSGVAVSLDISSAQGLITEVGGAIGGLGVGLKIGSDRRLSELSGPGSTQVFSYGNNGGGLQLSMQNAVQGTSGLLTMDATGSVTAVEIPGALPLSLSTVDVAGGSKTTANGSLELESNHAGATTARNYTGGLTENYSYSSDGSLAGFTVGAGAGSVTATVQQTPTQRTIDYGDMTVEEFFYNVGLRKSVQAPSDQRSFTYERLAPKKETHDGGIWAGYSIDWDYDAMGRLSGLSVVAGNQVVRSTTYGYDGNSRLNESTTQGSTVNYGPRNAQGRLGIMTRGGMNTTWSYNATGLLSGVTNSNGTGNDFSYSYPEYDTRRRIRKRLSSVGVSWTNLGYDAIDQLTGGHLSTGRDVAYDYDGRGNRSAQGVEAGHTVNGLDQVTQRTLVSRGFGLVGTVNKDANVLVSNPLAAGWQSLAVDRQTGDFWGWWDVPASHGAGAVGISSRVRGVLPPAVPGANPAGVADVQVDLVVPPMAETLEYDGAGRLVEDGFWTYTWDGAGRLVGMARKSGALAGTGMTGETVAFTYDADGRRTSKTHTRNYGASAQKVEQSKVLWAGWLPVLELRTRDGAPLVPRWFQWGADLSGTLDGAGGIGGLVAIIEGGAGSPPERTLLPVQDGLGNITAVVDASSGQTVARYEYNPFGELLGGSGEMDACPFRWQTKWFDAESKHYYFGYRYYDPRLGRWLSRDPLGEAGGFNLYAYCGNDPVNRHDPIGLMTGGDIIEQNLVRGLRVPFQQGLYTSAPGFDSPGDVLTEESLLSFLAQQDDAVQDAYFAADFNSPADLYFSLINFYTTGVMPSLPAPVFSQSAATSSHGTFGYARGALSVIRPFVDIFAINDSDRFASGVEGIAGMISPPGFDGRDGADYVRDIQAAWATSEGKGAISAGLLLSIVGPKGARVPRVAAAENALGGSLQMQKELSLLVNRQGAVVDRWLSSSNSRWARLYRSNPTFAKGLRGRILDIRMRGKFRNMFGEIPGVRIDQTIPGSGSLLRPDLYLPDVGGRSMIFDVGSPSKVWDIIKYQGMADDLVPLVPLQWIP